MEVMKESYVETSVYFTFEFDRKDDPGSGFSFPCDEDGNINVSNEGAAKNLEYCRKNAEDFYKHIKKHEDHYRHGATGKCDCGEIFELMDQYMGACQCPKCGRWFNIFGQELKDPCVWGDEEVI